MRKTTWICAGFTGLVVSAGLLGCSSDRQTASPAATPAGQSYSDYHRAELESERREFISNSRERLSRLDQEIKRTEARVEHEGQYVDEAQRAEWRQDLFELQQEQRRVQAELDRAENASEAEWAEMRGTVGGWVDSLEAGLASLGSEISGVFSSSNDQSPMTSGLCAMEVQGAHAKVERDKDELIVTITTDQPGQVMALRQRAQDLSRDMDEYEPAMVAAAGPSEDRAAAAPKAEPRTPPTRQSGQAAEAPLKVTTRVDNIDNGVRIVFTEKGGQLDRLQSQLEQDAKQLGKGRCVSTSAATGTP